MAAERQSDWYVYLVRCADGTLYTGITTDVPRRLEEHELGRRGAKYLRGRGPLELVFDKKVGGREQALSVERRIKRLPKRLKESLVRDQRLFDELTRATSDPGAPD